MKKVLAGIIALSVAAVVPAFAQKGEKDKKIVEEKILEERVVEGMPLNGKKTEEIIIRRKGDKDINVTVEIKGDKIMINGKPLAEFKDDEITINKRTMRISGNRLGNLFYTTPMEGMEGFNDFGNSFQFFDNGDDKEEKTTFLGVTTEDAADGAKISDVSKGSSAEKAGLKEGDVITKIGTTKIDGPAALSEAVKTKKPKEEVTVTYKRDGRENTTKATLGERVQKNVRVFSMTGPGGKNFNWSDEGQGGSNNRMLAIPRVQNLDISSHFNGDMNDDIDNHFRIAFGRPKLGLKIQDLEEGDGVKVTEVEKETAAEKSGLKKDDIITEIGGKKIKNTDDAREELRPAAEKTAYSIKAKRNGTEMSFEVKVPKKIKTASF